MQHFFKKIKGVDVIKYLYLKFLKVKNPEKILSFGTKIVLTLICLFISTLVAGNLLNLKLILYISDIILAIIFISLVIIFFWYIYEENRVCINNISVLDKKLYNFTFSKNLIFRRNYKPNGTIISINPCFEFFDFRSDFYIEATLNDVLFYSMNLTLIDQNLHKLYVGGYVCFVPKKSYKNNFIFIKNSGHISDTIGLYNLYDIPIYNKDDSQIYLYTRNSEIDDSYKNFLDMLIFLSKRFDTFSLTILTTGFILLSTPDCAFFLPEASKEICEYEYEDQLNKDYNTLDILTNLIP